jgi:uncharacterized membrane protein (UPF0182 family)
MGSFRFGPMDEGRDLGPPPGVFRFPRRPRWRPPGGLVRWGVLAAALIFLFVIANIGKGIYADWLWFDSVDYLSVYKLRIVTRIWLFFAGAAVFLLFFGANVFLAARATGVPAVAIGEAEPAAVRRLVLIAVVATALFAAIIFGAQAAGRWQDVLLFSNSQSFGQVDPVFHQDVGFYVFRLPLLTFIAGWALAAAILTTIAVGALYALRLLLGEDEQPARFARPHVSLLLVAVIALFIWRYWLGRYGLLYSERGPTLGASYTDLHASLPVTYVLMGLGTLTAVAILASLARRGLILLPIAATALWVVAGIVGGLIYPATVQRFQVEPNELSLERTYIQRNIEATRAAYGLDRIEERPFPARSAVTEQEIDANPDTIRNIRLWDHRPLLETLDKIQTLRPLYDFLGVDVDRYVIDGEARQVMLSARELNPDRLPEDAKSWVNRRLQFTHGFGLAMLPVNEVAGEGLPTFFVQDIPPTGEVEVTEPRLYYGEMPEHYVLVNSDEEEFDYPIGEQAATTTFSGSGGVGLNSFWRRLTYAWEFADTNILISGAINDDTRLLYRRNVQERIREIAPFLRLDFDPYLVVAEGRLVWVQDAYTTSDRYPYSTRDAGLNYIRNSVKVTVDAYDGSVTFYLVDPGDPIARAYDAIYPDLFTPFEEMPLPLRAHLRYPEELFRIQSGLYRTYHLRGATALYNREDLWDVPTESFSGQQQPVEPYYVIMRLPGEANEEFVLILPFRPASRDNTIAWLAARSDGMDYGKLLAFRFPTESLVFGPLQVEARIDQDTAISQQFSLWDQSGSEVIRGNLLMIPIGEGNLFVEPIYLRATTGGALPELKRVIVANGDNIAMEPTLGRALEVVLGEAEPTLPTVEPTTGPSATPGAGETPAPTATAQPTSELPDDVAALIDEANSTFERAQQLLQQGDFAGYGEEIARLEEILQRLAELTESP